ncbi:MAG: hypothetical protein GXP38_10980 [Chloroflexi bacterium]|nr:hypothetical protein [Chloroflexota bacterium]
MTHFRKTILLLLLLSLAWHPERIGAQTSGQGTPPQVWFDDVSWLRYDEPITLHYDGDGPLDITVQETTPGAERWWTIRNVHTQTGQGSLSLDIGDNSFTLRANAVDALGQSSGWVESQPINHYRTLLQIYMADHRGRRLSPVDPHFTTSFFAYHLPWYWLDDASQSIWAYIMYPEWVKVSPHYPGYNAWQQLKPTSYQHETISEPPTVVTTIYFPPLDNHLLPEAAAADFPVWEIQGRGRLLIINTYTVSGGAHQFFADDENTAYICPLWDFTSSDIANLNQPTLSFYYQTNIGQLAVAWQTQADGRMQTLQHLPVTPDCCFNWRYTWVDLSAVRTTPGRPCFEFTAGNVKNAFLLFDNIALGSSRSDLSLRLLPPPQPPAAGEDYSLTFAITNHSPYTATARIQLISDVLTAPQRQILPILTASETISTSFSIPIPETQALLNYEAVVGNPDIDDTPGDNTLHGILIPDPRQLYLPLQIE